MAYSLSYWENEENRILNILSRNLSKPQRESNERELATIRLNIEQFEGAPKTIPVVQEQKYVYTDPKPIPNTTAQTFTSTTTTTTTTPSSTTAIVDTEDRFEDESFWKQLTQVENVQAYGEWLREVFGLGGAVVGGVMEIPKEVALGTQEVAETVGQIPPLIVLPTITQVPQAVGVAGSDLITAFTQGLQVGLSQIGTGLGTGLKETGGGLGEGLNKLIVPVVIIGGAYLLLKNA